MSGKFLGEATSDDEALDFAELPSEYRVKGFLRSACHDGHETLIRVLLDKGADVNYIATNTQLPTALHVAVSHTRESVLPIILPQATNATIQAALQYAIQYQARLANIIRILQQDGTTPPTPETKDEDKDQSSVDKGKKTDSQRESETQTTPPSKQENHTQTNGSDGDHQGRQQPQLVESQPQQHELHTTHEMQQLQLQLEEQKQHLQEQQQQLKEQQQKLNEQQQQSDQAQKKTEQVQQTAEQAQQKLEEVTTQLQKQNDQLENQERQVHKLTEQLEGQETQSQKLTSQLSEQESQIRKLTEQLENQEGETQKLSAEISDQVAQIEQLKKRIAELEGEKDDLASQFESYKSKSDLMIQDFQAQIATLQKDTDAKSQKIESVSKERDTERRAKEVAKRILSSNGPSDTPDRLGLSHAIRMASVTSPSPTPWDDEDLPKSPSTFPPTPVFPSALSPTLSRNIGKPRSPSNGDVAGAKGGTADNGGLKKSKTTLDISTTAGRVLPKKLGSRSRAKDDMGIFTSRAYKLFGLF